MSSFFTVPASQRKRKHDGSSAVPGSKRRDTSFNKSANKKIPKPPRPKRDESISGSGSDDEPRRKNAGDEEEGLSSVSDDEDEDETGAERRLRLAERYLENVRGEVDDIGFDAQDIDRDLIAERLQEDVAETKGRLYRNIASDLDFSSASKTYFRGESRTVTSIAICPPFVYTVSKDQILTKWELTEPPPQPASKPRKPPKKPPPSPARRPTKLLYTKGDKSKINDASYMHHTAAILAVAASSTGKFVATGGADRRLIVWSASDLTALRVFTHHRDAITSLAFRRGTNQLYSSSKDRTVKTWSLDELAYVETLFGHQDEVVDVAALTQERCITVGARDRTARLWKVADETQLVFRGGGGGGGGKAKDDKKKPRGPANDAAAPTTRTYAEGSIDRIALIDEETFITGSDNGSISLWAIHKKKPVFTVPVAHGLDPPLAPEAASAEKVPDPSVPAEPQPRWISAIATVPYSDLVLSGSWDGSVRVWKVGADRKRIEAVGVLGRTGDAEEDRVRGVVNDIGVFERGHRGKDGVCVVAGLGTEHRFGKWARFKGKNGAVVFEVPRAKGGESTGSVDDADEPEGGTGK